MQLLPFTLAVIAGSVDVITFLGLGGLFTAHITGNLVVLAAYVAANKEASMALLLSVPVFIAALATTRLLAEVLMRRQFAPLPILLLTQFLLLCAFLSICLAVGPFANPNTAWMITGAMSGVCAMAVQNALVRIGLTGVPSTAVLTTNITSLTMDMGDILLRRDTDCAATARERARHTWPAVAGFLLGCVLGAMSQAIFGLESLLLPVCLALAAFALGAACGPGPRLFRVDEKSSASPKGLVPSSGTRPDQPRRMQEYDR